jgi:HemY protein
MIRIVFFLVAVALVALGVAWLADRPGDITIVWLGRQIETSVLVGFAALALFSALLMALWSLLRLVFGAPRRLAHYRRTRRHARGLAAISHGLIAIGAGDARAALKHAGQARQLAAHEPLTLLLAAQAAQLTGNQAAAEEAFGAMAARHDTKLLGLHGLFIEAQRRGDGGSARNLAEEAMRASPSVDWAARAALEYRGLAGDWTGALTALDAMVKNGLADKDSYRRQRAVLLTARARELLNSDRDTARALVLEAVKLAPDLVPAAALAGRMLGDAGETRRAARILQAAWRVQPHPDIADAFIHLRPGDTARDRLARAKILAKEGSDALENALALSHAALDAHEFGVARAALHPFIAAPTRRVALLMAEIEEAESGDIGRAREWMGRALRSAPDPAWTADGVVSETWQPVSPVTGRPDAFVWRVPLTQLAAPAETPAAAALEKPAVPEHAPTADVAPATDDAVPSAFNTPAANAPPRAGQGIIPLVQAPDDPGPDGDGQDAPEPGRAEAPPRGTWH